MAELLLTINAGSSSIKFAVFKLVEASAPNEEVNGQIEGISQSPRFTVRDAAGKILIDRSLADSLAYDHKQCLNIIFSWLTDYMGGKDLLAAVGHRVVHGGLKYARPVLVNHDVLTDLEQLIPLAPLHQPHNLAAIHAFQELMPALPQVACFDTAFHRTQPEVAQKFALPNRFFAEGVRRYGFHGLSYEYVTSFLPSLDPALAEKKVIVAHLGNGASLCAIQGRQSVATTMGFSPLDGLIMGTRCGSLDPGVILYLMDHYEIDAKAIEHMLYYESGLLGVSNIASDMRELLANDQAGAKQAIELFVYRVVREIGSMAAALGGLDALVFTGGIGEHAAKIRAKVCQQIAWLGLDLDDEANQSSSQKLSTQQSVVSAWVVNTNENLMIAQHTCRQIQPEPT